MRYMKMGIMMRVTSEMLRRLADSRNRVPAIPYTTPYVSGGWTR